LTANALIGQAEMFMENGFDGFISKPIDIRQLNASLNKLIRDKYPPETVSAAVAAAAALQQAATVNTEPGEVQTTSDPKLLSMFVVDAKKALAGMNAILVNGFRRKDDIRQYVINAHTLKSALANIGETGLSSAALELEQAGELEDIMAMMSKTPLFLEALREMINKYKPKEDDDAIAQEKSDEDPAYLNENLLGIQIACENYDVAAVNKTLAELEQKRWPHSVKKLLDTVSEYILTGDFEEAAKLAKDYARSIFLTS
jgi:HPt (histidine-containing phosphotransfer) domain-containing protein